MYKKATVIHRGHTCTVYLPLVVDHNEDAGLCGIITSVSWEASVWHCDMLYASVSGLSLQCCTLEPGSCRVVSLLSLTTNHKAPEIPCTDSVVWPLPVWVFAAFDFILLFPVNISILKYPTQPAPYLM